MSIKIPEYQSPQNSIKLSGNRNTSKKILTENEHGIREGAENGKKQATDNPRAQDLKQKLASIGQVGSGLVHEEAIDKDEEQVSEDGGGAG